MRISIGSGYSETIDSVDFFGSGALATSKITSHFGYLNLNGSLRCFLFCFSRLDALYVLVF